MRNPARVWSSEPSSCRVGALQVSVADPRVAPGDSGGSTDGESAGDDDPAPPPQAESARSAIANARPCVALHIALGPFECRDVCLWDAECALEWRRVWDFSALDRTRVHA